MIERIERHFMVIVGINIYQSSMVLHLIEMRERYLVGVVKLNTTIMSIK